MPLHWNISLSLSLQTHTHTSFCSFCEELLLLLMSAPNCQPACEMTPAAETSPPVIHCFNHSGSPTSYQPWQGLTHHCLLRALAPFVLFRTLYPCTQLDIGGKVWYSCWNSAQAAQVELLWKCVCGQPWDDGRFLVHLLNHDPISRILTKILKIILVMSFICSHLKTGQCVWLSGFLPSCFASTSLCFNSEWS